MKGVTTMKYRWAVTKARMIELAKQYMDITVSPKTMDFHSFSEGNAWRLDFTQANVEHHFFLDGFSECGWALMRRRTRQNGEDGQQIETSATHDLYLADLVRLGLLRPVGPQN